MRKIKFQNEYYYHIYNRGVDKRDIFLDKKDYLRFLMNMRELNNNSTDAQRDYEKRKAGENQKLSFGYPKLSFLGLWCILIFIFVLFFGFSNQAKADYWQEGVMLSTDLFSGISDEAWITGFTATSSVPASTTLGFLFSVDGDNWYNHNGEKGIWDTMASGTTYFSLSDLHWATSSLATTSLEFYYKARLTSNIATATPIIYDIELEYSDTDTYSAPDNGYYGEGILLSTDLLSGISDEAWITGFTATSSVPASTTLGFLFSKDNLNWYNSDGEKSIWDTMASGTTYFSLSALDWSTSSLATSSLQFWYKARLSSNIATVTPIIYAVSVEYATSGSYTPPDNGYFSDGIYVSNILSTEQAKDVQYFGYDANSIPASTTAQIIFSNDGINYYSSTGTAWQWTSLVEGDHLASSTGFDLTTLNWTEDLYYKIKLETNIATHTPIISEVKAYFTESDPVEFISIIDPDDADGTDYTSLSTWEQAVQSDLTATTTLVFSYSTSTAVGVFPDGSVVIGETSGATGTLVHLTGTSSIASKQLLISGITEKFQNGEKVYLEGASGNYVYLTTGGDLAIAVAKCRSTGGTADTDAVTIEGWTTSAANYIKVWTDPDDVYGRHNGKWDEGKYRLNVSRGTTQSVIDIIEDYVKIMGMQINVNATANFAWGIVINNPLTSGNNEINISHSIIKATNISVYNNGAAIGNYSGTGDVFLKAWNNIVYDFPNNIGFITHSSSVYLYNNTVNTSANNCFHAVTGAVTAINNIAQNCKNYGYKGVGGSSDYNISNLNDAPGTNSKSTTTVKFLDATNNDFHLHPDDTSAINAGTTTSALSSWSLSDRISLSYDIDGTLRGGAFDIGADEVPVEFVSTICENTSAGGDCTNLDYTSLGGTGNWEDKVECDLTASSTRVFSGTITGTLDENDLICFLESGTSVGSGRIVATTSDQILIDNIISSTTDPLISVASGTKIQLNSSNYWTVQGATTTDDLGASPIAIAKIDGAWDNPDTNAVTIEDWSSDNDNYIKIYTTDVARHNGKWNNNTYRLVNSTDANNIANYENYVKIIGLQLDFATSTTRRVIVNMSLKGNEVGYSIITMSGHDYIGIERAEYVYNNIVYNITGTNNNCIYASKYVYNNTLYNCYIGVAGTTNVIAKNNLIASTTNPFGGTFNSSSDYNATDINDTPDSGGSNNIINATIDFISTASGTEDFHLDVDKNSQIINAGADLSNDIGLSGIDKLDIDGGARNPDDLGWDIGADEIPAKQYRSVGNDSSDLSNGGIVTISSTTRLATFSAEQPVYVGVGDVIQYGSPYQLAFIISRASSTEYGVQTYDTKAPTATSSADFTIYRAHLELDDWEDQLVAQVNTGIDETVDDLVLVNQDLVASNTVMMVAAYASDNGDAPGAAINGWITSVQSYIKIYTPVNSSEVGVTQRHNGKWDDDKYYKGGANNLSIHDEYVKIDGLQLSLTSAGGDYYEAIYIGDLNNDVSVEISNNIIKGDLSNTSENNSAISAGWHSSGIRDIKIWNNIIYGFKDEDSLNHGIYLNGSWKSEVYNNTIYNSNICYARQSGVHILKNNIAQNCDNGYGGSFSSLSDYNISDIAGDQPASGAHDKMNTDVIFVDETNDDFHLSPDDTSAIDAGTSTVAETPLMASLQYDIDGDYRRTYDIGADEASVEFVSTVMETGGDFSSLVSWETANQADLTATTTAVFTCSSATGTIPIGSTITGTSSESTGTLVLYATSSSQILLTNMTASTSRSDTESEFIVGEKLYIQGGSTTTNYCIIQNAGNPAISVAKIDGAWTSADNNAVMISGWETGEYNYVKIYTADDARHNGVWDDGKYRLFTSSLSAIMIRIYEDYVRISGLQIGGSGEWIEGIKVNTLSGETLSDVRISQNIIKQTNTSNNKTGIHGCTYCTMKIWNNIVYGFGEYGISRGDYNNYATYIVYNNTAIDNGYTFSGNQSNTTVYLKNNITQGAAGCYSVVDGAVTSNNISENGTSPNSGYGSTTVHFLDSANNDFHLHPDDTSAINAGTTTSALSSWSLSDRISLSYDIDGTLRGGTFDIGADEVPVEFISTICENTSAGGDCANLDYTSLGGTGNWEDKVECDLTASSTRVFSGTITGTLNENNLVCFLESGTSIGSGRIVATTSDQILIDNIISSTTDPLISVASGTKIQLNSSNYWTVQGATTTDELGASPIAIAKIDGAWTSADTNIINIANWNPDNDNNIKIYTTDTARHKGKWNDDKYRLEINGGDVLTISENNIWIDGLQIKNTASAGSPVAIYTNGGISDLKISNNIIWMNVSADIGAGIKTNTPTSETSMKIWNNIIYSNLGGSNATYLGSGIFYLYNNTAYGLLRGFRSANTGETIYLKNNFSYNNDIIDYGILADSSSTNNLSSDDTAPACGTYYHNTNVSFVSTASGTEDFHLDVDKNSQIINAGADLSNDIGLSGIDKLDIDGGARNPDDLGWDIGADEVPAKQYRSVGNDSSDISSGGGTVTISSTTRTATFSEAQPTNIGVGDVIQYGSPYQLAFIISRASSTEYGVQNYDTKAPTATSSADFTIYRAHLELNDWESQLVAQVNTGISDTVDDLVLVEQDLVASNTTMMVSCYASDNGDDAVITFNGWDTGPQNYIKVYTPVDSTEVGATQRHDGKWNDDSYSIEFTTIASNQRIMKGGENYLRIDGLQIKYTSSYNDGAAVYIGAGDSSTDNLMYLSNNIIQGVLSNNSNATGLNLSDGDSSARSYVYNNIVYGFTGASCIRYRGSAYNNTAVNCVLGIATFNYEAINNIVQNSTTGFSGTNINSGYNISSDSTAPGNNSKINTAVNFIDQANNDFHLHPNDTTAIDAGTSTVSSLLTDDIDGDYRRTYDIGADEASVEFVSYITENAPSDGDFDNLSQWESTVQSDLTATTTAVFDVTSATGTFTLLASYVGQTSNATGTLVYISTTSNQILLSDITGDFTTGETISFTGSSAILSDSGNPAIAVAKIDGAWTSADNNAVTISGWETGEYNYVKIYTTDSARHNGKWDEGKYRLETTNNSGYGIRFYEDYTKLYGIQATAPSLGIYARVISGEGASNERVAYCIVKNTNNDSHNIGIYRVSYVYNNIVYDFNNNSSGIAEGEGYKYNNTVYNCARGIAYGGTVINNIVQDCTDGYYGSSNASSDYNISDISGDQPASGAHDKTGITVEFIDADNNDFHLDVTDTVAKDAGVDMNVLGFGFQVTSDDIDGHSRHDVGWDIGADEAPTIFYRSVGRHAYDLNTNSATATISVATNTATIVFSEDLPTNIGVGDAIEYGSPLQLAFITSRVSASTYYIQSATGSPPVATSSATASVYRAHEYLDDWEDQIAGDVNQVIDAGLQSDVLVTQDLVASNTAMFVPCYASSSADDLSVDIDGWTTGTSSYIKIYTPISDSEVGTTQRHGGIWNDIKYRIQTDPGNGNSALLLSNNFIKIIGIQLKVDGNGTSRAGINMTGSGIYDIRNNIIVGNITGSTYARGIKADSSMTAKYNLVNNVVYNWHNNQLSSAGIAIYAPAGKTVNVYNNTIYNCYIGIDRDGLGTSTIKNNVVFNNINDFANGFTIIEYNASDDGDGTNAISLGSSTVTWKAAFTDYENYDFSVRDLSSVLYDAGTTITIVTDDIIGTARPYHDIYDVGAFEFVNSKKGFRFKPGGNFKFKGHFEFK